MNSYDRTVRRLGHPKRPLELDELVEVAETERSLVLDARLVALVREQKRKHSWMPTSVALSWARFTLSEQRLPFEEKGMDIVAEFERDGFTVTCRYSPDNDADTSFWGEFTSEWAPNAIKHPQGWSSDMTEERGHYHSWIVPCNDPDDEWHYLRNTHSRHDAWLISRQHQREDVARLRAFNYCDGNDTYTLWYLNVTVSLQGIELGWDAMGGIDLGGWNEWEQHASIVAEDCVDQALDMAKTELVELSKRAKAVVL